MNQGSLYNNAKTFLLLAALTALLVGAGYGLGRKQGLIIALVFILVMNVGSYWFSDKIALAMSGAKEVSLAEAPQLYATIQRLAERASLPMLRVYIIPSMAPNAFATGRNPQHSAVAVTRGIMELLSQDEIEGVIAHELAHVKHRDILISSIAAVLAGALTGLARMARWGMLLGGFGGRRDNERGGDIITSLALMIIAPIAAMLVQLAVSRSREFEADRGGAEICGRPLSLANALLKLEQGKQMQPMQVSPAMAHMYIVNPFRAQGLANLFSTHPATEQRVARLREMAEQNAFGTAPKWL